MSRNRRDFLKLIGASSVVLLAACQSPAAAAPTAAPSTSSAGLSSTLPNGNVEVNFLATSGTNMNYQKQLFAEYMSQHPNVTITSDFLAPADELTKLSVTLPSGSGPDLFQLSSANMFQFDQKNLLAPFSAEALGYASLDALKAAYIDGTLDPYVRDGQLMSLPYDTKSFSLYLNTAHFAAAGLDPARDAPKTWDDVLAIGKQLVVIQGDKLTRNGFEIPMIATIPMSTVFEPLLWQFGGDVLAPDNSCGVSSPAAANAMNFIASLAQQKVWDPSLTVAPANRFSEDFPKEVTSMIVGHPPTSAFIQQDNEPMYDNKGFAVVPFPQVNPDKPITTVNSSLYAMSASSSQDVNTVVQDLVKYLMSRPQEYLSQAGGIISPVKAAQDSAEFKGTPFMDVFLTDIGRGRLSLMTPYYSQIADEVTRAIQLVSTGSDSSQQTLDQACQNINRAIQS